MWVYFNPSTPSQLKNIITYETTLHLKKQQNNSQEGKQEDYRR